MILDVLWALAWRLLALQVVLVILVLPVALIAALALIGRRKPKAGVWYRDSKTGALHFIPEYRRHPPGHWVLIDRRVLPRFLLGGGRHRPVVGGDPSTRVPSPARTEALKPHDRTALPSTFPSHESRTP